MRFGVTDEFPKRLDLALESPVIIEMFPVDVGDKGVLGAVVQERPVRFVRLGDEKTAASQAGIGADVAQ